MNIRTLIGHYRSKSQFFHYTFRSNSLNKTFEKPEVVYAERKQIDMKNIGKYINYLSRVTATTMNIDVLARAFTENPT
jgi:hypothetical protein